MNRFRGMLALGALALGASLAACERTEVTSDELLQVTPSRSQNPDSDIIPNQYIVLLSEDAITPAINHLDRGAFRSREEKSRQMEALNAKVQVQLDQWLAKFGLQEKQILSRFTTLQVGAALQMDAATYELIRQDPAVARIEPNKIERVAPYTVLSVDRGNSRAQVVPCGITNAGGHMTTSFPRLIWIVDTGIDLTHPDLNVVTAAPQAVSFVAGGPGDCTGHGTHLAGTAAAIDNTIGVVGISSGAAVVPVRVFDCTGAGSIVTILNGLNHVATYDLPGDVVNLGFGGTYGPNCTNNSIYKTPITALGMSGTRVSMSAGSTNSPASTYQPACINGLNVFTTTSMTCAMAWGGSNYGRPPIDFIATGRGVYSTYLGGTYATLDGSSMAAAHVTGLVHLLNGPPLMGPPVLHAGIYYPTAFW